MFEKPDLQYDKPLAAAAIGALATIPYEILTRALLSLGLGKYSAYQLTSLIITLNRPNAILGMILSITVGGVAAVLFYYALKVLGWDYLVIKSMLISLLVWVLMEALFVLLIEGPGIIPPRPISDYFIQMAGSFIFGTVQGLLFKNHLLKALPAAGP